MFLCKRPGWRGPFHLNVCECEGVRVTVRCRQWVGLLFKAISMLHRMWVRFLFLFVALLARMCCAFHSKFWIGSYKFVSVFNLATKRRSFTEISRHKTSSSAEVVLSRCATCGRKE